MLHPDKLTDDEREAAEEHARMMFDRATDEAAREREYLTRREQVETVATGDGVYPW